MNILLSINKLEDLDGAMMIADLVFDPTSEESKKYHDRVDWLNKLESGGLLVTAKDSDKIIGFAICYPRDGRFHIWNAGILSEYRGKGIWSRMYEEIVKFAKSNGFLEISLNTEKNKFSNMYAFAVGNGFDEYKVEGSKSYFLKNIG